VSARLFLVERMKKNGATRRWPPTRKKRQGAFVSETIVKPAGPFVAGFLAWVIPGAGHFVLGRRAKAILFFTLILGTFIAGWIISHCENVYFESGRWHTLVQMGAGLVTFLLAIGKHAADPKNTVMNYFEIGTLYTMVAALLNVLVVMDAVMTSLRLRKPLS
jgi:hypothetical protein